MKYFYYAIDSKDENGKYYAEVAKIGQDTNLLCALFERYKNAYAIKACSTKKEAVETADFWIVCHRINGNYLFDDPELPKF